MTALDGDPLTGDPTDPDVRWLLKLVRPTARPLPTPVPAIHEPCGLTQCGGCTARACVTRRPGPVPLPEPTWDATGRRIRGTGPHLWDFEGGD